MLKPRSHGLFETRIQQTLPVFGQSVDFKAKIGIENIVNSARANAPYLDKLCSRWPNIVDDLHASTPEQIFDELKAIINTQCYSDLCKSLRLVKQQLHLLTALCDLAGVWSWEQVTEALTEFTDIAMQALINAVANDMEFEGNERGPVPGLFVLALGKYGGRELNYSSDIDLIVFYDPDHIKLPNPDNAQRLLVRFVKKIMRGFDEITEDGYVFRTDLRLRPDPRANAVAVSTLTAERYYETLGQNWERAAMIKARYCGGDEQACEGFVQSVLRPFIWRRSLDYAAVADIHSIKRQIQGDAALKNLSVPGHDVKLGLGGIREIEFYAQVQQLILGGRNENLRIPKTVDILSELAARGYVEQDVITVLIDAYGQLRNIEHRVQMFEDKQTHLWPVEDESREKLTYLCGYDDVGELEQELLELFSRVHKLYSQLFSEEEDLSVSKGSLVFTGVEIETPTLKTLESFGFARGEMVWKTMARWLGGRIRAMRSQRARELLTRLAPRIIEACGNQNSPDDAFINFSIFLENLNSGISILSLFLNKPDTLTSVIEMLAIAPRLAHSLSDKPALIDAMVEPDFLSGDINISEIHYMNLLNADTDFETSLDIIRRAVRDDQFNLTTSILRLRHVDKAGDVFSTIAQAAIEALLPKAVQETERLYGPLVGEYAILALGKLGGREMSISSDLDLMLIYRAGELGVENHSQNMDTLNEPIGQFNKLTKRLISALSSVTSEGGLYEVDMALRPSGRSGPLAVSITAFESYYKDKAWTWEYMALSRARIVATSSIDFSQSLEGHIRNALADKGFSNNLTHDILDMRNRLQRDKPEKGIWDIKNIKGGLRDIEFIAQYLMLKHKPFLDKSLSWQPTQNMLDIASTQGWISKSDGKILKDITKYYHILTHIKSIAIKNVFSTDDLPTSVKLLMAHSVGLDDFEVLEHDYAVWRQQVSTIFANVII